MHAFARALARSKRAIVDGGWRFWGFFLIGAVMFGVTVVLLLIPDGDKIAQVIGLPCAVIAILAPYLVKQDRIYSIVGLILGLVVVLVLGAGYAVYDAVRPVRAAVSYTSIGPDGTPTGQAADKAELDVGGHVMITVVSAEEDKIRAGLSVTLRIVDTGEDASCAFSTELEVPKVGPLQSENLGNGRYRVTVSEIPDTSGEQAPVTMTATLSAKPNVQCTVNVITESAAFQN